ncbi:MAG: hypothetical protein ACREKS_15670 [Candidatus Rokuibacteriota bacterium]
MNILALSAALLLLVGPTVSVASAQPVSGAAPTTGTPERDDYSGGAVAGAVAVNVFRVPGKTLLCGLTVITTAGLMLLTLGTQYRMVGAIFREGCGGKWVIGPGDLDRDVDPPRAIFSSHP